MYHHGSGVLFFHGTVWIETQSIMFGSCVQKGILQCDADLKDLMEILIQGSKS